jgi:beta-lactamase class D
LPLAINDVITISRLIILLITTIPMRIIIILCTAIMLLSTSAQASDKCLLVQENGKILKQEGDCDKRYSPGATFDIVLALIGYQEGVLTDQTSPNLSYQEGYADWVDKWQQEHNPRTWMQHGCFWYSQIVAQQIGMDKLLGYMAKFSFGNQDLSADKDKNNEVLDFWLESSLQISPQEYMSFLQKLVDGNFAINRKSYAMTKNILFIEKLPGGWQHYGTSISKPVLNKERTLKLDLMQGWSIDWIEKDDRTIFFINHLIDRTIHRKPYGLPITPNARKQILKIIKENNW